MGNPYIPPDGSVQDTQIFAQTYNSYISICLMVQGRLLSRVIKKFLFVAVFLLLSENDIVQLSQMGQG